MPLSVTQLVRFAKAITIDGRLLGVEFILTPKQIQAIKEFARKVLP